MLVKLDHCFQVNIKNTVRVATTKLCVGFLAFESKQRTSKAYLYQQIPHGWTDHHDHCSKIAADLPRGAILLVLQEWGDGKELQVYQIHGIPETHWEFLLWLQGGPRKTSYK